MHTVFATIDGKTLEITVPDVGDFVTIETNPYSLYKHVIKGKAVKRGVVAKAGNVIVDLQCNQESDTTTKHYLFPGEYTIDDSGMSPS